ncbi:MAG TPA: ABC transporter ATP-binding protein [Armatimonadota bacterium]|nr:ABC transporter ATP-binding protein [Armatimonadota bacterium]
MIEARNLKKLYRRGAEEVRAVDGVSFEIDDGEFVAVVGPSGAGKTTLLQLMGAMDKPTSGTLRVAGHELSGLSDGQLTRLRRESLGFVFQQFGLLPTLSVEENVALPALFGGRRDRRRVDELLERVGLAHRRRHRPGELSGGEMQRAAIARALYNSPRMILADEPTGNLDSATSARIFDLLWDLHRGGLTVVVVTHNEALADAAERRLMIRDGLIVAA